MHEVMYANGELVICELPACGEPAIEQSRYDEDMCAVHFEEAIDEDQADLYIKMAKE